MAIVESVVEILLQKLADPLVREAIFLHEVSDQVEWLEAEFRRMQHFLEDTDAKQEEDRRVKGWVGDVRDVAYDAEDVIDTFLFEVATARRTGIKRYARIFNELIARHQVGSKIERIKSKIRAISESRWTYGIHENIGQVAGTSSAGRSHQEWRLTSPNVEEPDFVGFDNDLKALVTQLTNEGELRRCVVSVVGMGGLGKTTLTRKVYNTDSVKKHFHTQAWISISQQHTVKDLLQTITKRCMVLSKDELKLVEKMDVVELRDKISQYLKEKRYLVVLDDLWTKEAWNDLKDAFPDVNNGSRVMLTTRNKVVALYADPRSQPHELRFLTNEESWDLLCKKTLILGREGNCPKDLKKLGREIVKKCHGLPLAIAVVGGLLLGKEPWEWENVSKSISWQFIEGEVQISRILSLSYKDLPYYLKPCFLYLGNFPEGYEFKAKELIRLWAAEGFLKERGELTLEEVGEDHLMQLGQRSMVQLTIRNSSKGFRNSSKGIKSCRIHDLLRELSISEAKESKFLEVQGDNGNALPACRARRLAIHLNDPGKLKIKQPPSNSTLQLRSMLIYTQDRTWLQEEQRKVLFEGFKLLRVLYLDGVRISELPKQIGELIHLRYLKCTETSLHTLPSSIGNLINLQTLFVKSDNNIEVPETIGKMHQLRHLQLPQSLSWGVIQGHPRLDLIRNLQTLSRVRAGNWMEGCLGNLTNLRELKILFKTGADAELFYEAIVNLKCLQNLSVWLPVMTRDDERWSVMTRDNEGRDLVLSLPNLSHLFKLSKLYLGGKLETLPAFPINLTKLTLESSGLEVDPMATLEKLQNLRILGLRYGSYGGKEMACSAQGFPRLESLHLVELFPLEEWKVNEGAMPCLLHLLIYDCKPLKKLPEGLQHVTTLEKLELWSMPDQFKARVREDGGEDWYKIQHIPYIDIR